jgi:hypothetical protein
MSDIVYAGTLRLNKKQVNFLKTLGNDGMVESMMTKGSKAQGLLSLLAAQFLKMTLTENEEGAYILQDYKKRTVRVRFSHRKGNVSFTRSAHRGIGREFDQREFNKDLKGHDGFLIIDTAEFSLATPVLHFWGISQQTVKALYDAGLMPKGSLTRNRMETMREEV